MAEGMFWVSWIERHDAIVEVPLDGDDPQERARQVVLDEVPPFGERVFEFESEIDEVKVSAITNASLREFADLIIR